MKKRRRTTEPIIRILRDGQASGMKSEEVCRIHNSSAPTYYRWKRKDGGMDLKEARRLRELEKENPEFKKRLADQLLKTQALEIVLEKRSEPGRAAGEGRPGADPAVVFRAIGLPVAWLQSLNHALSTQATTATEEAIN